MAASGFAGLGYQIVWTQQCALWLGHEAAAVLAVVAAFFGGLAVGALVARRPHRTERVGRCAGTRRARATIALWSLVAGAGDAAVGAWCSASTGVATEPAWQWTVAFVWTFVLLPAGDRRDGCDAAGDRARRSCGAAARAAIDRRALREQHGRCGARRARRRVLARAAGRARRGPRWSASRSISLVPRGALVLFPATEPRRCSRRPRRIGAARRLVAPRAAPVSSASATRSLVVRVLSQVTEDTVYTFALLLAVYLVGTALGAAAYARRAAPHRRPATRRRPSLLRTRASRAWSAPAPVGRRASARLVARRLGDGMAAALGGRGGARCSRPSRCRRSRWARSSAISPDANAEGIGFGRALGVNTLGAALRTAALRRAAGAVARSEGRRCSLIALGYVALTTRARGSASSPGRRQRDRRSRSALLAPPLAFVDVPDGGRIVSLRRRRDGGGERRRGRRGVPACASTTASRKAAARRASSTRARRCCRCCCILHRAARCSSASAPG